MKNTLSHAIVWFRQDLRLSDNPAFTAACREHDAIIPIYILDDSLPLGGAQRWWLHHSLLSLQKNLKKSGLGLCLRQGNPLDVLTQLLHDYNVQTIYWNRCYEPFAIERDTVIKAFFQASGIRVITTNGSLLHEPWEIKTQTGSFFKVFTPFWRACLKQITVPKKVSVPHTPKTIELDSDLLVSWKLLPTKPNWAKDFALHWEPGERGALQKLEHFIDVHLIGYDISRDVPFKDATSKLSPHFHFGEISVWDVWRAIERVACNKKHDIRSVERFLSEMGWREFSYHLLYHIPSLPQSNFKSDFDAFPWKNDPVALKAWQQGNTGYPIVDAGMRELWHTGYMHNRVRMIVASFLTKHLLIDWRIGASWFLDTLVDADTASNSASWQWVAGCGADAAPYFRIFNPILQGEKFDPDGAYVKQWVPELRSVSARWIHQPWMAPSDQCGLLLGKDYPHPIVDHAAARKRALLHYQTMKKKHD